MRDIGPYAKRLPADLKDVDLWIWQCRELTEYDETIFLTEREKTAGREFPRLPRLIVLSIYFAEFISLLKRTFRA